MKKKPLTADERLAIAEKAAKVEGLSVQKLLGLYDDRLRAIAEKMKMDEWAEDERNSDWLEEMGDQFKEEQRIKALPYPGLSGPELSELPQSDLSALIALAEKTAREAHHGQFRKDGVTPYITHPAAVAAAVPDEVKPIAWLHDVIEDTAVTLADLRAAGFPEHVLAAVQTLTKIEGEDYEKYLARVCANPDARRVKLADLEHNLSGQPSEKAREKYLRALPILLRAQNE